MSSRDRKRQEIIGELDRSSSRSCTENALAESFLQSVRLNSPPSTFCLDPSCKPPDSPEAQRGMVLRILRYVSPLPWGSPRAEADRRTERLDRIITQIWGPLPAESTSFTVGGQVLWSYHPRGIKRRFRQPVWIASRLPPSRRTPTSKLELDLTQYIMSQHQLDQLWDNRFRVRLRPHRLPAALFDLLRIHAARVCVAPHGKFCTPRLLWREQKDHQLCTTFFDECQLSSLLPEAAISITFARELEDL